MSSAQELKKIGSVSLVNPLVLETLEKLIDKKKNTAKVAFNSDLQKIYSTVTQKSFTAAETLIKNLIDFGRSIRLILDTYFPIVARRLGDHWVSDKLTFAEVTLALANLQLLNSKFEPLYLSDLKSSQIRSKILLVVPTGEDHTFGAISVTRKLRSMGTQTILLLDYQNKELEDLILGETLDLIGISSGNNFMTEKINALATFLTSRIGKKTPIALGGNLVSTYKKTNEILNVDLISTNPEFVLDSLGIKYANNKKIT